MKVRKEKPVDFARGMAYLDRGIEEVKRTAEEARKLAVEIGDLHFKASGGFTRQAYSLVLREYGCLPAFREHSIIHGSGNMLVCHGDTTGRFGISQYISPLPGFPSYWLEYESRVRPYRGLPNMGIKAALGCRTVNDAICLMATANNNQYYKAIAKGDVPPLPMLFGEDAMQLMLKTLDYMDVTMRLRGLDGILSRIGGKR